MATTRSHRTAPSAARHRPRVIDGKRYPICRWCDEPIRKEDGSPAHLLRTWHKPCLDAYMLDRGDQRYIRKLVYARDRGVCAGCGHDTIARLRQRYRERSLVVTESGGAACPDWEADHIVPLKPVRAGDQPGEKSMENLQTLCVACHKRKTGRENGERFRGPSPRETMAAAGQAELPGVATEATPAALEAKSGQG